jgi:hypothetical protein
MPVNLESRIAALEAAKHPAQATPRRVITREEAEEAYTQMMAPTSNRREPDDGLTSFERYMRMLNG